MVEEYSGNVLKNRKQVEEIRNYRNRFQKEEALITVPVVVFLNLGNPGHCRELMLVLYLKCSPRGPTSAMLGENLRGQDKEAASSQTPQEDFMP